MDNDSFRHAYCFLKLQQAVLDSDDNSALLTLILPKLAETLREASYAYEVMSIITYDLVDVPIEYTYDAYTQSVASEGLLNLEGMIARSPEWSELLSGRLTVSANVTQYFKNTFQKVSQIKTVVLLPLKLEHKIAGAFFLATSRESSTINQAELTFLSLLASLMTTAHKLQTTQKSLTTVSESMYKMNMQLHQLDKLKDDFVSIASHELRTPMTAIRSYAWMALYKSDVPLSEKLTKYLTRTLVSTERLINLVNDMLNISRIESGRVEILPKEFDLIELTNDVIAEVESKIQEKNIHMELLNTQIPHVFADPDKIHQVILNFVGNALKFTPVQGTITVSFFTDGEMVELNVKDSGVGISKDDLPKLFKKFGRLDSSYVAAATTGGTGLGLYISKMLIELSKGQAWATSEGAGKGATFSFTLPIATPKVLAEAAKYTTTVEPGQSKGLEGHINSDIPA